ncbi:expressed protein, partial [Phakopsora pachyrhizi]
MNLLTNSSPIKVDRFKVMVRQRLLSLILSLLVNPGSIAPPPAIIRFGTLPSSDLAAAVTDTPGSILQNSGSPLPSILFKRVIRFVPWTRRSSASHQSQILISPVLELSSIQQQPPHHLPIPPNLLFSSKAPSNNTWNSAPV